MSHDGLHTKGTKTSSFTTGRGELLRQGTLPVVERGDVLHGVEEDLAGRGTAVVFEGWQLFPEELVAVLEVVPSLSFEDVVRVTPELWVFVVLRLRECHDGIFASLGALDTFHFCTDLETSTLDVVRRAGLSLGALSLGHALRLADLELEVLWDLLGLRWRCRHELRVGTRGFKVGKVAHRVAQKG